MAELTLGVGPSHTEALLHILVCAATSVSSPELLRHCRSRSRVGLDTSLRLARAMQLLQLPQSYMSLFRMPDGLCEGAGLVLGESPLHNDSPEHRVSDASLKPEQFSGNSRERANVTDL